MLSASREELGILEALETDSYNAPLSPSTCHRVFSSTELITEGHLNKTGSFHPGLVDFRGGRVLQDGELFNGESTLSYAVATRHASQARDRF